MKIYKLFFVCALLTCVNAQSFSQDLKEDLRKCYKAYADLKDFSSDVRVYVYKNDTYSKPYMTMSGDIKKAGSNYYSHFEKNTVLCNDSYMIFVDDVSKYVYYKDLNSIGDKKRAFENPYDPKMLEKSIDSIMSGRDTIQYNGISNGSKQYFIRSKKLIYLVDLYLDVHTNLITKLVYYYNKSIMKENNKVSVEFINTSLAPVFASGFFSERRFISVSGSKITVGDKYKGYDLLKDEQYHK